MTIALTSIAQRQLLRRSSAFAAKQASMACSVIDGSSTPPPSFLTSADHGQCRKPVAAMPGSAVAATRSYSSVTAPCGCNANPYGFKCRYHSTKSFSTQPETTADHDYNISTTTTPGVIVPPDDDNETMIHDKIQATFDNAAFTSQQLSSRLRTVLSLYGYEKDSTLLATSLCCDEVNRTFEDDLRQNFQQNFNMGGLAGFAFGGVTSFGAMAAHIPDDGHCLMVYGPHVGIDSDGVFGKVDRRGQEHSNSCCGSAAAAANYVTDVYHGKQSITPIPTDSLLDAQQAWVGHQLLPHTERLIKAQNPSVELPNALYDSQDELVLQILEQGKEMVSSSLVCLVGGIQVNTPPDMEEYFVPKRFQLWNNGQIVEDLMEDLY